MPSVIKEREISQIWAKGHCVSRAGKAGIGTKPSGTQSNDLIVRRDAVQAILKGSRDRRCGPSATQLESHRFNIFNNVRCHRIKS